MASPSALIASEGRNGLGGRAIESAACESAGTGDWPRFFRAEGLLRARVRWPSERVEAEPAGG